MVARGVDEEEARYLEVPSIYRPADIFDDIEGDLGGSDVLGYSARLAVGDGGASDLVEKGGLAVVHVAHHADDGGSQVGLGLALALLRLPRFLLHAGSHPDPVGIEGGDEAALHADLGSACKMLSVLPHS